MSKDAIKFNCPVCNREIIAHSKQDGNGTIYPIDAVPIGLAMEFVGHAAYCGGCEKILTYAIHSDEVVKMCIDKEE